MNSYSEYKDSKLPWLGDVPCHWQVNKFKYIFNLEKRAVNEQEGVVTAFRDGEVTLRTNRRTSGFTNSVKEIGYQGVRKNDLVVHAMDAFAGAIGVSDSDGKCTPVYSCCTPKNNQSSHYYSDLLRVMSETGFIQSLSKGIRERSTEFRWADLSVQYLPEPPPEEQGIIVNFLASNIKRTNELISEKENFIKLLQEKRQALISHVVTKGLNPNVEMKSSGVEWIGEIPEHWEIKPIKYLGQLNPNKSELKAEYLEGTCSFVPMTKLKTDSLLLDEIKPVSEVYDGYTYFKDEDVLFAKVTPCFENKNMCIAKGLDSGIGFGSSEINVFRVNKKTDNRYFYYLIQENQFMQFAKSNMTGTGGLKRVPSEVILDYKIAIPSIEEQIGVADYLESKFEKINLLTSETNKSIELLKEHRTALISAAVTGKIDVREMA